MPGSTFPASRTALQGLALIATTSQPDSPALRDKFAICPILLPLAIALVAGTTFSLSPITGFLFLFAGLMTLIVWAVVISILIVSAARRHAWRRAISLFAILVVVWPAILPLLAAGDYLHLVLLYPYYCATIGNADKAAFAWPVGGIAGGPVQARTLVYDTTPETARELGTHSKIIEGLGGPITFTTTRLMGHFYLRVEIIE